MFSFLKQLQGQATIQGKITDANNGLPLGGVIIQINSQGTTSLPDGSYLIAIDSGAYEILFNYPGYEVLRKKIDALNLTQLTINVSLKESNIILQTAVISTSKYEVPISESTISIDVLKPTTPEKLNSTSIQQVLDRVPGVQIIDGQANIRGGSGFSYGAGSRVMLIMDDLPFLQPDAGFPNWDDIPLEQVGQIEILKGAASSLYGSAAMNGVIHFRTTSPTIEPYTAISLIPKIYFKPKANNEWWGKEGSEHTTPGEMAISFIRRQKLGKWDYNLGGYYINKTGYNKGHNNEFGRFNALLRRRINDRFLVTLGLNLNQGMSSSYFYWKDKGLFVGDTTSFSHSKKLRFTLDPSLQYFTSKHYKHKLLSRWMHIENGSDNNQSNKSENLFLDYQIHKLFEKSQFNFSAGMVCNYSYTNSKLFSDTLIRSLNLAPYMQLEKKLLNRLTISGGVRFEYYRLNGPELVGNKIIDNPSIDYRPVYRLGANFKLSQSTFLRCSWGQGFRFPTLAEKYIETNAGVIKITPNPDLKSEFGESYELGIKQGIQFGAYKGILDLSAFASKYQDMMEFTLIFVNFSPKFQSQNVGDTYIRGLELSSQGVVEVNHHKFLANGGYTYLIPLFQEWDLTGKELSINATSGATRAQLNAFASSSNINILKYRNRHLFRMDIEYNYHSFFVGVNFNYASHTIAVDQLFEREAFFKGIKSYRDEHNTGYRIYDTRIGYQFNKITAQININNLTNEDYSIRPGLMEGPRNISARLTWKLE